MRSLEGGSIQVLIEPAAGNASTSPDYQFVEDGRKTARAKSVAALRKAGWTASFVLALDVSKSISKQDFEAVRAGTAKFLADVSDAVAVIAFGDQPQIVARFEDPRVQSIAAINALRVSGRTTHLYDALERSLRLLSVRSGSEFQQVIVISDGAEESHVGPDAIDDALARAMQRGVRINAVWIPTLAAGARNTLVRTAERTGGLYFDAKESADISAALSAVTARTETAVVATFARKVDKAALTREVGIIDNRSGEASTAVAMQIPASAVQKSWNDKFKAAVEFLSNLKTLYGLLSAAAAATGLYLASFFVIKLYFPSYVHVYPVFIRRTFGESEPGPLPANADGGNKEPAARSSPRRTIVERESGPGSHPALTLVGTAGAKKGEHIPVLADRFSIGAGEQNDLALNKDEFVSGHHARIEWRNGRWLLIDESRNGTVVDGERIDPGAGFILRSGQSVRFGNSEFRVQLEEQRNAHAAAGLQS